MTFRVKVALLSALVMSLGEFAGAQTHPIDHAETFEVSEEMKALGVGGYVIQHAHEGGARSIQLGVLDLEQSHLGDLDVEWLIDGAIHFELRIGDEWIELRWDPIDGEFILTDLLSGREAESRLIGSSWTSNDESGRLIDLHQRSVALAALGLQDYLINIGQRHALAGRTDDTFCPSGGCSPSCTGPIVRGSAFANTRSWCCEQAREDAAFQCWNEWCLGCCRYLGCDANCVTGDYLCVCGMTGYSCGPGCL